MAYRNFVEGDIENFQEQLMEDLNRAFPEVPEDTVEYHVCEGPQPYVAESYSKAEWDELVASFGPYFEQSAIDADNEPPPFKCGGWR